MTHEWNGWLPDGGLLKDQVALIAGGGGGIGEATTRILAAAGARVAVLDNDSERAAAVAADVVSSGGTALALTADLRDEGSCSDAVQRAVDELGGIDILTNVAGGMGKHAEWRPLHEWTNEAWDVITHLNLGYVFWTCRAAIPSMEARGGGAIVNVTSIAGSFGSPGQSAYGAAKAGLEQLTKSLAVEYGPIGIRANSVSPGVTMTEVAQATVPEETCARLRSVTPMRRLGRPEDIARAVLFLASPMADHMTGQALGVDGGVGVTFPYPGLGSHSR